MESKSKTGPSQAGAKQTPRFPSGSSRKEVGELKINEPINFILDAKKTISEPDGYHLRLWNRSGVIIDKTLDSSERTFTASLTEEEAAQAVSNQAAIYDVYASFGSQKQTIAKGRVVLPSNS